MLVLGEDRRKSGPMSHGAHLLTLSRALPLPCWLLTNLRDQQAVPLCFPSPAPLKEVGEGWSIDQILTMGKWKPCKRSPGKREEKARHDRIKYGMTALTGVGSNSLPQPSPPAGSDLPSRERS